MAEDAGAKPALGILDLSRQTTEDRQLAYRWWCGGHLSYRIAKRALDLVAAILLIALTSPILLIATLAIRLDSTGPALFRQARVGRHGSIFRLYKFRGMYVDALERFPELYTYTYEGEALSSLRFHPKNDPRVTRVGRFLRRTSIDELPNLFNVLRGEMSLVGPRPEIPEMLPYYGEALSIILGVKPGVTSPAKATGRDELTFAETLTADIDYVRTRSFSLDMRVLCQTVVAVVRQDGVD